MATHALRPFPRAFERAREGRARRLGARCDPERGNKRDCYQKRVGKFEAFDV